MDKELALYYIDVAAGEVRSKYLSCFPGQEITYVIKAQQARQFQESNYTGPLPSMISAECRATGSAPVSVTQELIAIANAWEQVGAEIEYVRRKGKIEIESSTSPEQVNLICAQYISQLKAL